MDRFQMLPRLWVGEWRGYSQGLYFRPLTPRARMVQNAVTDASTGGPPVVNGPNGRELHGVDHTESDAILATLLDTYIERYGYEVDLPFDRLVDREGGTPIRDSYLEIEGIRESDRFDAAGEPPP